MARMSGSADGQVVADEVELGVAPLGEEDLLGVGDRQLMTGRLHDHPGLAVQRRSILVPPAKPIAATAGELVENLAGTADGPTRVCGVVARLRMNPKISVSVVYVSAMFMAIMDITR